MGVIAGASYGVKIIKGTAPGDLPNRISRHARARHYLKTAKTPGIEVPSVCFIDNKAGIIVDVEHTRANRIAEIAITDTMIERFRERFDLVTPFMARSGCSSGGWTARFWDKSARSDGTFSRADFVFDRSHDKCRAESRQSRFVEQIGTHFIDRWNGPTAICTAQIGGRACRL